MDEETSTIEDMPKWLYYGITWGGDAEAGNEGAGGDVLAYVCGALLKLKRDGHRKFIRDQNTALL